MVKMFCGHLIPTLSLRDYLVDYCVSCGNSYSSDHDYTIFGNVKLCEDCLKYNP